MAYTDHGIVLTEEEIAYITTRRERNAKALAYNDALRDAYNVIVSSFPMSETRTEVVKALQSLFKVVS